MKHLITIIAALGIFYNLSAQINFDRFDIPETDTINLPYKNLRNNYYDQLLGLRTITDSKNIIEIRLYENTMFDVSYRTICFDGNNWTGKWSGIFSYDSLNMLNLKLDFLKVLDTLNQNHIFTLPNQETLKLKGGVDDGADFILSYKMGNKFRSYYFSNPELYLELNKGEKVLENYIAIIKIFDRIYLVK